MRIVKHVRRMKPSARTLLRVFTVYALFAQSMWRGAWSKAKAPRAGGAVRGEHIGVRKRHAHCEADGCDAERGCEAPRIVVGRVGQTNPARLFFAAFADRCGGVLSVCAFRAILFAQL